MRKNEVAVVEKKENKGLSKVKKAVAAACSAGYMALNTMPMTVFAAGGDTSAITQPLDNLKTLVIAIIGAVGVIILAKNVMEFAQAYQQTDKAFRPCIQLVFQDCMGVHIHQGHLPYML